MTASQWFKQRFDEAAEAYEKDLWADTSRDSGIPIPRLEAIYKGSEPSDKEFKDLFNAFEYYVGPKKWDDLKKQILYH